MHKAIAARWSDGKIVEVNEHKGEAGNVLAFAVSTADLLVSDALIFADVVLEGLALGEISEQPDLLCLGVMSLPDAAVLRDAQAEVRAKFGLEFCVVDPGQTILTVSGGELVSIDKQGVEVL